MTKREIVKWFIAGLVAFVPAVILIPSSALAWAAHLNALGSANTQGWLADDYSRRMLAAISVGAIFGAIGLIAQIAAWVGAVANSNRLADKRWFRAVLWSGIAGVVTAALLAIGSFLGTVVTVVTLILFGISALSASSAQIAYLVGGPDAVGQERPGEGAAFAQTVVLPKTTIARWFGWGWPIAGAGLLLALLVSALTDPGRALQGHTWTALVLMMPGFVIASVGAIAESIAWWAALFNTHRLNDKTWFNLLLWGGVVATVLMPLFGLGALIFFAVGIAYLRGAPDGSSVQPSVAPTGKLAPVG